MSVSDLLVVVATPLEAERLPALRDARVVVSGIGAVNAALATQAAILESRPRLAVSVGIAGAYPWGGASIGEVIVASRCVYAGLGAEDDEEFLNLELLGFPLLETRGSRVFNTIPTAQEHLEFARVTHAKIGEILTLETVTGSERSLERLQRLHPNAIAEAMEGAGVAHAAALHGIPALEVRGISNAVEAGRHRESWRIGVALDALHDALETGWMRLLE
ncbi:MAG: futalosine hydrolase [Pleurocapsa sp. SU_196_0]|nr:futalosine hydrolase [Pleurocapsa sp. SU_196_0]